MTEFYLSASLINKFLQCPKSFYFELQNQRPIAVDDRAMIFGKVVHEVIVSFYNNLPKKSPEDAFNDALKQVDTLIPPGFRRKMNRVRQNFLNFARDNKEPIFLEKRFKAKLFPDLPEFVGVIDAYYPGGIVVDWKTGREDLTNGDHSVQGKLYQLLLEANGYEVNKVIFAYLDTGRVLPLPRTTKGFVYEKARKIYEMIKRRDFPRKVGYWCKYCPYRLACELEKTPVWCYYGVDC